MTRGGSDEERLNSTERAAVPRTFEPLSNIPELDAVMSPTIAVDDHVARALVLDRDGREIRLAFQPYQALQMTTVDCYRRPPELPHRPTRIHWSSASEWIDQLTATLRAVDRTADFMDRAIHFIVPAGDDVLEVIAWAVAVDYRGTLTSFPTIT